MEGQTEGARGGCLGGTEEGRDVVVLGQGYSWDPAACGKLAEVMACLA